MLRDEHSSEFRIRIWSRHHALQESHDLLIEPTCFFVSMEILERILRIKHCGSSIFALLLCSDWKGFSQWVMEALCRRDCLWCPYESTQMKGHFCGNRTRSCLLLEVSDRIAMASAYVTGKKNIFFCLVIIYGLLNYRARRRIYPSSNGRTQTNF